MNKKHYLLSLIIISILLISASAKSDDEIFRSYDVPLKNQGYQQLVYQTSVVYSPPFCDSIAINVLNTTTLPSGVTWDDFALVVLYNETVEPANSIYDYADRQDALVFRHLDRINWTYGDMNESETFFMGSSLYQDIPFPYSVMTNGTIPYYQLWKEQYEYVLENKIWYKTYPQCMNVPNSLPDDYFNFEKDNPYAFKVVLYYMKTPPVTLKLDIFHVSGGILASSQVETSQNISTSSPTSTASVDESPLAIDILIPFFAIIWYKKKRLRQIG